MFLTIKKKAIIACILGVLLVATFCATYFSIKANATPKPLHAIVIDAGHGGVDGGAVGTRTGVDESHLNLDYAMTLKKLCEDFGIGVTMTRSDMNGLYSATAPNKKRSEMEKRKKIIEKSSAELLVSIHMNSFSLPSARGAQVFYALGNEQGKSLGDSVQAELAKTIPSTRPKSTVGDYFVLNCTKRPGILVECGFLSNPEEEALLVTEEHRRNLCYSILAGILKFYDM